MHTGRGVCGNGKESVNSLPAQKAQVWVQTVREYNAAKIPATYAHHIPCAFALW